MARSLDAVARQMMACGMPEIAADLRISPDFVTAAKAALAANRPILVDVEMVRHGIIDNKDRILCTLNDPRGDGLRIHGQLREIRF